MLLNADLLAAEAAERRKESSKEKVKRVFEQLCAHIAKSLTLGRGVNLPSFGLFGFQQITEMSLNGSPLISRIPVFALSERFARANNLRVDRKALASGVTPAVLPNYSLIGEAACVTKDECAAIIRDLLTHIGDACRDERPCLIELGFGQFKYTRGKQPFVRFSPDFMRRLAQHSEQSARALSPTRTPRRPSTAASTAGHPSTVTKASPPSAEKRPRSASRTPRPSSAAGAGAAAYTTVAPKAARSRPLSAPRERPMTAAMSTAERPYSPLLGGSRPSTGKSAKARPGSAKRPATAAGQPRAASGVEAAEATLDATGSSLEVEPPASAPATIALAGGGGVGETAEACGPCGARGGGAMDVVCDVCRERAAQLAAAAERRRLSAEARATEASSVRLSDRAALEQARDARARARERRRAAAAAHEQLSGTAAAAAAAQARPRTASELKLDLDHQLTLKQEAQRAAEEARRLEVESTRRAAAALAEEERRRREEKVAQQRAVAGALAAQVEEKRRGEAKEAGGTSLPGVEGLETGSAARRAEASRLMREQLAAAAARKADAEARARTEREADAAVAARVRQHGAGGGDRSAAGDAGRGEHEASAASLAVGEELDPERLAAAAERARSASEFNAARRRELEMLAAERAERGRREREEAAAAAHRAALARRAAAERRAALRRALDLQVAERAGRALLEARADADPSEASSGAAAIAGGVGEEAGEECPCCIRCHGRLPTGYHTARPRTPLVA
eukprot:tig00000692_g3248.t1